MKRIWIVAALCIAFLSLICTQGRSQSPCLPELQANMPLSAPYIGIWADGVRSVCNLYPNQCEPFVIWI